MTTITRYIPTALEQKLYTEGRVKRILNLKSSQIEFIYPCEGGCIVGFFNGSEFIEKEKFLGLLVGDRKNRSKNLTVTPNAFDGTVYTVRNNDNNNTYRLETYQELINCSCKDYENLSNDFGTPKVSCKHIYAVLGYLGHTSLNEYLKHNKPLNEPSEYGLTNMAQGHY